MADSDDKVRDLASGVPIADFDRTGMVAGKRGEDEILLVRTPTGYRALGATCTHKGAPLWQGLLVGSTIRCPWHHACFDTRTGEAVAAPAFRPQPRWQAHERDGRVFVGDRIAASASVRQESDERIVIVGAGAGGAAAADALARLGFGGCVTLIGNEPDPPYDRTMLSKHFLAGTAGEDDLAVEIDDLSSRGVQLRLGTVVAALEPEAKIVRLGDGTALPFTKLILATGAEPRRLTVPGAELAHVRVLRSAADARGIVAGLAEASTIVVVGGSFIGLEAAAALRDREMDVTVVSPDQHPFARTLGTALAEAIMAVHRKRGTAFRLGRKVVRIEPGHVVLDDGSVLAADLVVVGIGVSPRTALAERAGLKVDGGVIVDERLRTSDRDIYAVGDIARWPDPVSGERLRVEHWAVAQRQGQIAAANAVGRNLRYDVVPFFWTMHFDFAVRYVGHGASTDRAEVEGDPGARGVAVRFLRAEGTAAVATVDRDVALLQAEIDLERRLGAPAATLPIG